MTWVSGSVLSYNSKDLGPKISAGKMQNRFVLINPYFSCVAVLKHDRVILKMNLNGKNDATILAYRKECGLFLD